MYQKTETNKMTCPICHAQVDYLLGDVRQGCEGCYKPELDTKAKGGETYDESREIKV